MRLLLDTHALIWFAEGSSRLSAVAKSHIEDSSNDLFLSVASIWELAIKVSLGRLELDTPFAEFIEGRLAISSIVPLEISRGHVYALLDLPHHHGDPFDRLLATQCLVDDLHLISVDEVFDVYGVRRIW